MFLFGAVTSHYRLVSSTHIIFAQFIFISICINKQYLMDRWIECGLFVPLCFSHFWWVLCLFLSIFLSDCVCVCERSLAWCSCICYGRWCHSKCYIFFLYIFLFLFLSFHSTFSYIPIHNVKMGSRVYWFKQNNGICMCLHAVYYLVLCTFLFIICRFESTILV